MEPGPLPRVAANKAPDGERRHATKGYWQVKAGARWMLEHRHVMERHLGRPLAGDENVHHMNGDRGDNRIGNLELWSRSQPPGQRVTDKVEWAAEFLRRYRPELLRD